MSIEQMAEVKPCVVCVMPTFSRIPNQTHLIEESVQSFLNQDYENRLLVIVNDNPTVKLVFDHPKVHIVNTALRFESLGQKYNYGFSLGHAIAKYVPGVMCMTWEDDDLMLSNHISRAVERLGDYDYWNPEARWFSDAGGLHWEHGQNQCHHAGIFTIEAFDKVGGYDSVSGPQDTTMDQKLRADTLRVSPKVLKHPSEWTYIYQWGVSENHLSGNADSEEAYRNEEARVKNETIIEYTLNPHWITDYQKIVNETLEMIKCPCGKLSVCSC